MAKNVLFVDNADPICGVHQFGVNAINILRSYYGNNISKLDTTDPIKVIKESKEFDIVIFNYSPFRSSKDCLDNNPELCKILKSKTIVIHGHDNWTHFNGADEHIDIQNWQRFGRPIPLIRGQTPIREVEGSIKLGTFGFPFKNKNLSALSSLVKTIQNNGIENIEVNINMARWPKGDHWEQMRRSIPNLIGCDVKISNKFMGVAPLIDFLAENDLNFFLYDDGGKRRSISSCTDYALAARKPIALLNSEMFRHLRSEPMMFLDKTHPLHMAEFGISAVERSLEKFSATRFLEGWLEVIES